MQGFHYGIICNHFTLFFWVIVPNARTYRVADVYECSKFALDAFVRVVMITFAVNVRKGIHFISGEFNVVLLEHIQNELFLFMVVLE